MTTSLAQIRTQIEEALREAHLAEDVARTEHALRSINLADALVDASDIGLGAEAIAGMVLRPPREVRAIVKHRRAELERQSDVENDNADLALSE